MPQIQDDKAAFALVHEGWGHLSLHRPLAAWACWQRAVRLDPDQPAARKALDRLAVAPELPETARIEYRFRTPTDSARRLRWDAAFQGQDLTELAAAAQAFAGLASADPGDADAIENLALCLAWLGRNSEAVKSLDAVVGLTAATDFPRAVAAWKLAEVLRQGGGAEDLADDFSHAIDLSAAGDPDRNYKSLVRRVVLRRLPSPIDPAADPSRRSVTVDEWLDRDWPEPREGELRLDEIPRVLAIVFASDRVLKLSLPIRDGLGPVLGTLGELGIAPTPTTRTPRPLAILDAAIWTIRLPAWIDDETRRRLYRENVEDYYENRWINLPRKGLDGVTPLIAAGIATEENIAIHAKLEATIAIREELAARPASVELYQGYPFDRLRNRLGLPLKYPEAVDEMDVGCMSGPDLDKLTPESLDDFALADALASSVPFWEDPRTIRFAVPLIDRRPALLARVDLEALFAPLFRATFAENHGDDAFRLIDQAIEIDQEFQAGRSRKIFTLWRAEMFARIKEPDKAVRVYEELIEDAESAVWVAIEGAATLLNHGHVLQGRRLAEMARELAIEQGDSWAVREAEELLPGYDT